MTADWHWPYHGRGELSCPHGVGHGGFHGCDGCCTHESFLKAYIRERDKGTRLK